MKTIHKGDEAYKLTLWDTAGQEQFKSLIPNYLKDAHLAIILYDITKKKSFENVPSWISLFQETRGNDAKLAIVGSKLDLEESRHVSTKEGEQLSQQYGGHFIEVSAKNGDGVIELFSGISQSVLSGDDIKFEEHIKIDRKTGQEAANISKKRSRKCCK